MKCLLIFVLIGSLNFFGCKKPAIENTKTSSKNITGKWNYTQAFYSMGGPLIFTSTAERNQSILFETDSSFSSNVPAFENFNSFRMEDSAKIKFLSATQQERIYFYRIDSLQNSLTLSPADFICIEGCGDIFKK
ncbi:MAG: hypothetical protein ABIN25_08615 [Ginsengibacter sp.]